MRFFMVDRITRIEDGVCVEGLKNVSFAEDFFNDFRPGIPTLPPPVLIESLAQLGVWFLAASSDFTRRALLLSLGEVRFDGTVQPGDQLVLENWVESQTEDAAVISGRIRVGDRTVMEMSDCICAIVPTGDLEDPLHTRRMFDWLTLGLDVRTKSAAPQPILATPPKIA